MTAKSIPGSPAVTPPPDPMHNAAEFAASRDDVFGRIARRYDLLCDLFSFGIHRLWKRAAARRAVALNWRNMLDAGAGTGHIALRVARGLPENTGRQITVSDISEPMLAVARQRAGEGTTLTFRRFDAEALSAVPDNSFDLYTIAFVMKIVDRDKVVREALRVLQPGGTFICVEASEIPFSPLRRAYLAYMNICLPVIGYVATGGDRSAYDYLLRGIHAFPSAEGFAAELTAHGFEGVSFRRLSIGIVAIHEARKPAA